MPGENIGLMSSSYGESIIKQQVVEVILLSRGQFKTFVLVL